MIFFILFFEMSCLSFSCTTYKWKPWSIQPCRHTLWSNHLLVTFHFEIDYVPKSPFIRSIFLFVAIYPCNMTNASHDFASKFERFWFKPKITRPGRHALMEQFASGKRRQGHAVSRAVTATGSMTIGDGEVQLFRC